MKRLFQVMWFSLRKVYEDLFLLWAMGGLWFLVTLGLPSGVYWLLDTFVRVPWLTVVGSILSMAFSPPFSAAIHHVTFYLAREKRVEFSYFWQGLKIYFWPSYKITLPVFLSGAVLANALFFYLNNTQNTFFLIIGLIMIWMAFFWLGVQTYLFPLLMSQEDKSLKLILKNASLLTLSFPFFVVGLLIVQLLFTALSIAIPILLMLLLPFLATSRNRALVVSLQQVKEIQERQQEVQEEMDREDE